MIRMNDARRRPLVHHGAREAAMTRTRDLMAELELTMVPSLIRPPEGSLGGHPYDAGDGASRRHFWCSIKEREVEVVFQTVPRRLLGARITGVKSCTAFEDPTAVACDRACVDGRFRSQWPDSLRVGTRPAASVP
jgi:hypothetical protein